EVAAMLRRLRISASSGPGPADSFDRGEPSDSDSGNGAGNAAAVAAAYDDDPTEADVPPHRRVVVPRRKVPPVRLWGTVAVLACVAMAALPLLRKGPKAPRLGADGRPYVRVGPAPSDDFRDLASALKSATP